MTTDDPSPECLELAVEQAPHIAQGCGQQLPTAGTTFSFEKGFNDPFGFQTGSAGDTPQEAKNRLGGSGCA